VQPEITSSLRSDPIAAASLFLDWISGEGGSERVGLCEVILWNLD
jgi:hypothetical protein